MSNFTFHPSPRRSLHNKRTLERELMHCAKLCSNSVQKSLSKPVIFQQCRELSAQILSRTYQPQRYTRFAVQEPKTREIYAPAFTDRLVQYWLAKQLQPIIERVLIDDTYANRMGKGTYAAIDKVQKLMRKPGHHYYLQLDVQTFFNHIDKALLQRSLHNLITNKASWSPARTRTVLYLIHQLLAHNPAQRSTMISGQASLLATIPYHKQLKASPAGIGLPIGCVTSQVFANFYLNRLDHYIKHQLRVKGYVRYMDDLILFASHPQQLVQWQALIREFLSATLKLKLHPTKQQLQPVTHGANYLGYIIYPHYKHIRTTTLKTFKSRLLFFNALITGNQIGLRSTMPTRGYWYHMMRTTPVLPLTVDYPLLKRFEATINSYYGLFAHAQHIRLRKHLYHRYFRHLERYFMPQDSEYKAMKIRKQYAVFFPEQYQEN